MRKIKNLFGLFLALTITAFAQNHNDVLRLSFPGDQSGARAAGMGNAFTAVGNDYNSVLFNPAGLGLVKDFQITTSMNSNRFENEANLFGTSTIYNSSDFRINDFGAVFPLPTKRGSMVLAFGYSTVKNFNSTVKFDGYNSGNNSMIQSLLGLDDIAYSLYLTDETGLNTPISGGLQESGNILESGRLGSWNFSGAVEIAKGVFVGGTINVYTGKYKFDRQYLEEDLRNNYLLTTLTDPNDPETAGFNSFKLGDIIDWDIEGWDARIGILYNVNEMSTIGVSIKLPSKFKITEDYTVNASSEFGTGLTVILDPPIENNLEYNIATPFEFSLGHALTLGPVLFSTDIKFTDYTQMEFEDGLPGGDISQINRDIKDIYNSVLSYNLGVEIELPSEFVGRAGYFNIPSPFKGDPSAYDHKYFTIGLGIGKYGPFKFNLAFTNGWWDTHRDLYGSEIAQTFEKINFQSGTVSFTYEIW